jgi:hypothetical protein
MTTVACEKKSNFISFFVETLQKHRRLHVVFWLFYYLFYCKVEELGSKKATPEDGWHSY